MADVANGSADLQSRPGYDHNLTTHQVPEPHVDREYTPQGPRAEPRNHEEIHARPSALVKEVSWNHEFAKCPATKPETQEEHDEPIALGRNHEPERAWPLLGPPPGFGRLYPHAPSLLRPSNGLRLSGERKRVRCSRGLDSLEPHTASPRDEDKPDHHEGCANGHKRALTRAANGDEDDSHDDECGSTSCRTTHYVPPFGRERLTA